MRLLPAIDLLGGQVVRGVAGNRRAYQPVESVLCADARPATVARALVEKLGLRDAYLADLDAIAGAEPAWEVYREVIECGLDLRIDAGLAGVERARKLAEFSADSRPIAGIVAGLESLPGPHALAAMLEVVGAERLVFSLDLDGGQPRSGGPAWRQLTPETIAARAVELGVQRFIVLDLTRVGMGQGVGTEGVCRALRRLAPDTEIVAGGGVRDANDLDALARAGCNAALVASALHDGSLRP